MSTQEPSSLKTILLVEDDVPIGEVLVQAITQETTHITVVAQSGEEALKLIESIKPSLLILDYRLPGMTGLDVYDDIHGREEFMDVPAMMISAQLPTNELKKRKITGMNKPLDLDEFLQTIERLLA
ncbi:MAG TPA: response regulator [Ktedonobacter sp.]|nr:response regulator [Ktedonobacter sp.]